MSLPLFIRRLRRGQPIVIVSGLPRSGTSMMMRMLSAGGMPILSDGVRAPDESNPTGYYEFDPVKDLATGVPPEWLDRARGQAVKIIAFLLTWLPETYDYRVIFMTRDLQEIVASQQKMLAHQGDPAAAGGADRLPDLYAHHLGEVRRFLAKRACFTTLDVEYRRAIEHPEQEVARVAAFLGRDLDLKAMAKAVDPALYRNRHG